MAHGKGGRPTSFSKETRDAILTALQGGSTIRDACAIAGIGETTYHRWLSIGKAASEGRSHPDLPRRVADREQFREFWEAVKKAQAAARFRGVTTVQAAGRDRWVHGKTGQVRASPPPPVTWMNKLTGELAFEDPIFYGDPDEWERQWSGEAWACERGDWRALAWYLERSDFEHWGRRVREDVYDWRVDAAKLIREHDIPFEIVEQEVGRDLAVELFESAGVSVNHAGKAGTRGRAQP